MFKSWKQQMLWCIYQEINIKIYEIRMNELYEKNGYFIDQLTLQQLYNYLFCIQNSLSLIIGIMITIEIISD